jgi:hypothetical protein
MQKDPLLNLEIDLWAPLTLSVLDKTSSFRYATFSTIGLDQTPEARIVVLRKVDDKLKSLEFHTDKRSKKYEELIRIPEVSILFYDPFEQIQTRMKGIAELHHQDEIALSLIKSFSSNQKRLYGLTLPPGQPGERDIQSKASYSDKLALDNFCLIKTRIHVIDYLKLDDSYHKRARFSYENAKLSSSEWIMP